MLLRLGFATKHYPECMAMPGQSRREAGEESTRTAGEEGTRGGGEDGAWQKYRERAEKIAQSARCSMLARAIGSEGATLPRHLVEL